MTTSGRVERLDAGAPRARASSVGAQGRCATDTPGGPGEPFLSQWHHPVSPAILLQPASSAMGPLVVRELLLGLQTTAGNHAVARQLARLEAPGTSGRQPTASHQSLAGGRRLQRGRHGNRLIASPDPRDPRRMIRWVDSYLSDLADAITTGWLFDARALTHGVLGRRRQWDVRVRVEELLRFIQHHPEVWPIAVAVAQSYMPVPEVLRDPLGFGFGGWSPLVIALLSRGALADQIGAGIVAPATRLLGAGATALAATTGIGDWLPDMTGLWMPLLVILGVIYLVYVLYHLFRGTRGTSLASVALLPLIALLYLGMGDIEAALAGGIRRRVGRSVVNRGLVFTHGVAGLVTPAGGQFVSDISRLAHGYELSVGEGGGRRPPSVANAFPFDPTLDLWPMELLHTDPAAGGGASSAANLSPGAAATNSAQMRLEHTEQALAVRSPSGELEGMGMRFGWFWGRGHRGQLGIGEVLALRRLFGFF